MDLKQITYDLDAALFPPDLTPIRKERPSKKTILYAIFMRTLVESSTTANNHMKLIREKLMLGEVQYYYETKKAYSEINELAKVIWSKSKKKHSGVIISIELLLEELWTLQQEEFEKYFKLRHKPFLKLYKQYAAKRSVEVEQVSFAIIETIKNLTEQEGLTDE
jgi:hypothetical protein